MDLPEAVAAAGGRPPGELQCAVSTFEDLCNPRPSIRLARVCSMCGGVAAPDAALVGCVTCGLAVHKSCLAYANPWESDASKALGTHGFPPPRGHRWACAKCVRDRGLPTGVLPPDGVVVPPTIPIVDAREDPRLAGALRWPPSDDSPVPPPIYPGFDAGRFDQLMRESVAGVAAVPIYATVKTPPYAPVKWRKFREGECYPRSRW